MTEAEWLACPDAARKLECLGAKGTDRKLRLLAVAWCRQIESLFLDAKPHHHSVKKERRKALQQVIQVAEKYADGHATKAELNTAFWKADRFLFGDNAMYYGG